MVRELRSVPLAVAAARAALLAFALLGAGSSALASTFVCTTKSGRTITADQPPYECYDVQIRELNPDGSTKRIIEPPPSPEQRRQQELQAQREQERLEIEKKGRQRDKSLIETYVSEDQIISERDHAVANLQLIIDQAGQRLEEYRQERIKLDNEAEFYVRRKLPPQLKRAIEVNEDLQRKEQKIIEDQTVERQRITKNYDDKRQRYHELMERAGLVHTSAAPPPAQITRSALR